MIATAVLMVLASAALPVARVSMRRQNEADLRRVLREMRHAIDQFKDNADRGNIASTDLRPGSENYPASLEMLVEGVTFANDSLPSGELCAPATSASHAVAEAPCAIGTIGTVSRMPLLAVS